jgi:hypothetical protein
MAESLATSIVSGFFGPAPLFVGLPISGLQPLRFDCRPFRPSGIYSLFVVTIEQKYDALVGLEIGWH